MVRVRQLLRLLRHPGVYVEVIDGVPEYRRACETHQYLSLPADRLMDVSACPSCLAEFEGVAGQKRYRDLHAADNVVIREVA